MISRVVINGKRYAYAIVRGSVNQARPYGFSTSTLRPSIWSTNPSDSQGYHVGHQEIAKGSITGTRAPEK
jgi:hypothetical protein